MNPVIITKSIRYTRIVSLSCGQFLHCSAAKDGNAGLCYDPVSIRQEDNHWSRDIVAVTVIRCYVICTTNVHRP